MVLIPLVLSGEAKQRRSPWQPPTQKDGQGDPHRAAQIM